jgi:hypothetical protein
LFENDLTEPLNLLQAQAVKRRLPKNHAMMGEIEEKIRILSSGYQGEKTLNYFLGLIPEKKYHIFHGLRLPIGKDYFQIDAILLSPRLIILLEAKNNSGTLTIEKHQMTQEYKDSKEIYQNPVAQVNRHKILLKYFFEKHQIHDIPMENLVVICKSTTKITIAPGYAEAERKVCKAFDLLKKLGEIEKYYSKERMDQKTIGKVKKLLLTKHTPLTNNLPESIGIKKFEIIPGVQCPKCAFIPMDYQRQTWVCPNCHQTSRDAHLQAINDYFLLINPVINNPELRRFLHIPSSRAATYLFSLLNFPHSGTNRARIYFNPEIPTYSNHVFLKKTNNKKKGEHDEKNTVHP